MRKRQGAPQNLSTLFDELFERRLLVYAVAAGATIAAVPSSHAQVVFTPSAAILQGTSGQLAIDLDHDGAADFVIILRQCAELSYGYTGCLSVRGAGGINAVAADQYRFAAAPLLKDVLVGRRHAFLDPGLMGTALGYVGRWANTTDRYLGVKFVVNGEIHFGWIGFRSVSQVGYQLAAKLAGWAYETNPITPILTGDMGTGTTAGSFQPTSLEMLATGHAAAQTWRERKVN
jgi:hypothetical protein